MSEVTLVLQNIQRGDASAGAELLRLVYEELRRLAVSKMAQEAAGQTLQPTALVHEAWLRLGGNDQAAWQNRRHFFGAAGEAMRRILIDQARKRHARRHGGGLARVNIEDVELANAEEHDDETLLALSEALEKLALTHPKKAELVKLRYFVGLSAADAAQALDISEPTAKRWWVFARAWLLKEMKRS